MGLAVEPDGAGLWRTMDAKLGGLDLIPTHE